MVVNGTGYTQNRMNGIYSSNKAEKAGSSFSDKLSGAANVQSRTDTVEFSSAAKAAGSDCSSLRGVKSEIENSMLSGADASRLKAIKSSVADGSYKIDSSELAGLLLDDSI